MSIVCIYMILNMHWHTAGSKEHKRTLAEIILIFRIIQKFIHSFFSFFLDSIILKYIIIRLYVILCNILERLMLFFATFCFLSEDFYVYIMLVSFVLRFSWWCIYHRTQKHTHLHCMVTGNGYDKTPICLYT